MGGRPCLKIAHFRACIERTHNYNGGYFICPGQKVHNIGRWALQSSLPARLHCRRATWWSLLGYYGWITFRSRKVGHSFPVMTPATNDIYLYYGICVAELGFKTLKCLNGQSGCFHTCIGVIIIRLGSFKMYHRKEGIMPYIFVDRNVSQITLIDSWLPKWTFCF